MHHQCGLFFDLMGLDLASVQGVVALSCRQPCCEGQADRGQCVGMREGLTRRRFERE